MHLGWPQFFVALVALVAIAGGGSAAALGFGSIRASVVLGQPLNLAVPVVLAESESLAAECASAEITSGDTKLPAGDVRVRVTQGRDASEVVLRVMTSRPIDEPVLSVTVNAGCPTRLSRTLVLFADPPLVSTVAAPAEPPRTLATVAPVPSLTPAAAPPGASPPPRATRPPAPQRATRTARNPPARSTVAAAAPAAPAASPPQAAAPRRALTRAEPRSRLQLDPGQVGLNQAAVLAAQDQASAARATASAAEAAASAAAERLQAMEGELARVRAEAKAQTDALLQIRQELALGRAERERPSPWMLALFGVAAVLAALVAWLAWRLRKQAQMPQHNADWWERGGASMAPYDAEADFRISTTSGVQSTRGRLPSAPAPWSDWPDSRSHAADSMSSPQTVPAPTAVTIPPMPPAPARDEEADRAMSVDEQIDLEQQADFFIALGHDDAAIDLLMAHMRSTGGGSPLPFLKLLEIHRRRDQREAYERTRVRFNQRFNSVAPEWQADPKAGRKLEDYTLAMGRIQRAWPAPLDATAELEALLFRRGAGAELFDLPAYQEVLFLYQMARDLHDAENRGGAADVDVLLPIGGRSAPVAAAVGTIVLRPEFNNGQPLSLDLDLSGASVAGALTAPVVTPAEAPVTEDAADKPMPSVLDLELTEPVDPLPGDGTDPWSTDPDAQRREN